jgi:hypothetical protein
LLDYYKNNKTNQALKKYKALIFAVKVVL